MSSHPPPPRIVVVTGATGGQGGAIIDVLLTSPPFSVQLRGTTRSIFSPASQSLISRGVEMVQVDYNEPSTLSAAFVDAWAIFAVTDFWERFTQDPSNHITAMDQDFQHGCNLARAAAGVKTLDHYIWSTEPSSSDLSKHTRQSFLVPHFDGKALVDDFIRTELRNSLYPKTTCLWVTFYAKNLQWLPMWKPCFDEGAGKYTVRVPVEPETRFASLGSLKNVGLAVAAIIAGKKRPNSPVTPDDECQPKYIFVTNGFFSLQSYYDTWAKVVPSHLQASNGITANNYTNCGVNNKILGPGNRDTISGTVHESKCQVQVQHVSEAEYETLYGGFGKEMRTMFEFWREMGEQGSWWVAGDVHGESVVVFLQDLLKASGESVIGLEESFRELSWEGVI